MIATGVKSERGRGAKGAAKERPGMAAERQPVKKTQATNEAGKEAPKKSSARSMARNPRQIWDYAKVPRREWVWKVGLYDVRSVVTEPVGVRYGVDDLWDSHGSGFQTYDELLARGPSGQMPAEIERVIRDLISEHRCTGGSHLTVDIHNQSAGHVLWSSSLSLDDRIISAGRESPTDRRKPLPLFSGCVPSGQHVITWALVFDPVPPRGKSRWLVRGGSRIVLAKGVRRLRLEVVAAGDKAVEVRASLGQRRVKVSGVEQVEYSADL